MEGSSADHWLSTITAFGVRPCLADRLFRSQDHPGRAVGDLRGIARRDLAPRPLEHRLQSRQLLRRRIRPHAVVMVVELAVAREGGFDLALEPALRLRVGEPLVAFGGIGIRLRAGDAEEMADLFGGLSHVEVGDRIGQPALQPDDRLEIARPGFGERRELGDNALGAGQASEPAHALLRPDQRRVAQRFGAAGQDQVGIAFADVAVRRVDRLHAGAAIDLHREGHHGFAHAEPQRGDAGRVHLVGNDVDAAEDDLIERVGREGLPGQQRPAALHGEIDRGERPGTGARLQERRPAAVDDIDRSRHQLAARCSPNSWKN